MVARVVLICTSMMGHTWSLDHLGNSGSTNVSQQLRANVYEFIPDHAIAIDDVSQRKTLRGAEPIIGNLVQGRGRVSQCTADLAHFCKILRVIGADADHFQPSPVITAVEGVEDGHFLFAGAHHVAQ